MPLSVLNDTLSRHNREQWNLAINMLESFFSNSEVDLSVVVNPAAKVYEKTGEIDGFIQDNTSEVCPLCMKVCCINRHGYYDYEDLIYIFSLGQRPPLYREGLKDTDPCGFLSETGCRRRRELRPFRCNWYFCTPLLEHMERGPAVPYRNFVRLFSEILKWRRELIEAFFRLASKHLPP